MGLADPFFGKPGGPVGPPRIKFGAKMALKRAVFGNRFLCLVRKMRFWYLPNTGSMHDKDNVW